jgi:hypothetical protein
MSETNVQRLARVRDELENEIADEMSGGPPQRVSRVWELLAEFERAVRAVAFDKAFVVFSDVLRDAPESVGTGCKSVFPSQITQRTAMLMEKLERQP